MADDLRIAPPDRKSKLAIFAFVLALLAPIIPGPGFFFSLAAAVCGHVALNRGARTKSLAVAAIIIGWLGCILGIILVVIILPLLLALLGELSVWINELFSTSTIGA